MEGVDCPVVPPKLSGKVDSAKLGQVVKSINSELSYVCYTFNNYEAPIPKHLSSSRGDATRRQRSNSAVTARKKSYSIGKEARPALETILGKDGRPVAEGSVGKNFILGQDVRVMVEGSVYSNVSSPYSSTDKDLKPSAESITSSRPTAESSVGRFGEIAGGKLWADSLPAESSPLKSMALVTETSEDVITDRGETTRRGAFGYKRGSFSRKVAVSLRPNQEGSFFSKAPPTVPRNGI